MKRRKKIVLPKNIPSAASIRLAKQAKQNASTWYGKAQYCLYVALISTFGINVWIIQYVMQTDTNKPILRLHGEAESDLIRWELLNDEKITSLGTLNSHAYIPNFLLENPVNWKHSSSNVTTILSFEPVANDDLKDIGTKLLAKPFQLSISCEQNFGLIDEYCTSPERQNQIGRCEKQTYNVNREHPSTPILERFVTYFNQVYQSIVLTEKERRRQQQKQKQEQEQQQEQQLAVAEQSEQSSLTGSTVDTKCRTLWFSAFSESSNSKCIKSINGTGGIRMDYAVALASARAFANDTLQPVLLLGRYGLEDNEWVSPLRRWASDRGAIVITVKELSFQQDVLRWHNNSEYEPPVAKDFLIGPYLGADLPKIIRQHNLFTIIPNICPRHVLYTENDVMFMNPITHSDMNMLKSKISPLTSSAFILYGREDEMSHLNRIRWFDLQNKLFPRPAIPVNTGVMLIDIYRYEKSLPKMISFRNTYKHPERFIHYTQGWFNYYFKSSRTTRHQRTLLPIYWNWKMYWPFSTNDDTIENIKIVHYHGPKPCSGAWQIAGCDIIGLQKLSSNDDSIKKLIQDGICCDYGKVAYRVKTFYTAFSPNDHDVC